MGKLNYVGSITLDVDLMKLANIRDMEQVHVLDIDNGNRLVTYAIAGGPGDIYSNGAAARLVQPGDKVVVISYADYDEAELEDYYPQVVHVDTANRAVPADVAQQIVSAEPRPILYEEVGGDSPVLS